LVGPDTLFGAGISILMPVANMPAVNSADFLVHLPSDEWVVALEVSDPVTATLTNYCRGSVLACHLL